MSNTFNLKIDASSITPPTVDQLGGYPYLFSGINPNYSIPENLRAQEKLQRRYIAKRLDISEYLLKHDIAHLILALLGLTPYDNFNVFENLIYRLSQLNGPSQIKSAPQSVLAMEHSTTDRSCEKPINALDRQLYSFNPKIVRTISGYLENPNKIPFLYKTLRKLQSKGLRTETDVIDLIAQYPYVIQALSFYYNCLTIDKQLLDCITSCLEDLKSKTGVTIKNSGYDGPEEILDVNPDLQLKEKTRTLVTRIVSTIEQFKIDHPETKQQFDRYSLRNLYCVLDFSPEFIANYLNISLDLVEQYIAEDRYCQQLPQIKKKLSELSLQEV